MASPSRPGPIQAIVGEDTYLAEESLERVLAAAVGADRQDALQVLYGDEKKWEDVLGSARTGSLFASRRAVVVRRADLLKDANAPTEDEPPEREGRKTKVKVKDARGRVEGEGLDGVFLDLGLRLPALALGGLVLRRRVGVLQQVRPADDDGAAGDEERARAGGAEDVLPLLLVAVEDLEGLLAVGADRGGQDPLEGLLGEVGVLPDDRLDRAGAGGARHLRARTPPAWRPRGCGRRPEESRSIDCISRSK